MTNFEPDVLTRSQETPLDDLPPRLRVHGGQLIKPNGKPILLRGVTLGSFPHDQPEDAVPIRELGANCVRVMLRWHGMWGRSAADIAYTDSRDPDGFAYLRRSNLQKFLQMCWAVSDQGMWVVAGIDSQCGQSGTQDESMQAYCDPYAMFGARGRNFYTDVALRRTFTQIVLPTVAALLRPIPRVALLEVHPEPASHRGEEYAPLVADVQRDAMEAIRAGADTDTPFLLGSRDGYEIDLVDEAEAYFAGRTDIVWTGNTLNQWVCNPDRFDHALEKLSKLRERTGCAVFQQQLGRKSDNDRDCAFLRRALARSREEEIGYSVWAWKQHRAADDGYGLNYPADDTDQVWIAKRDEQTVLAEDWGGTPPPAPGRSSDTDEDA